MPRSAISYEGRWYTPPSTVHRGWITRWRLRDLLSDGESSPEVAKASRTMHARLEKLRKESCGGRWGDSESGDDPAADEIAQISDEFHTIGYVDGDEDADCEHFNIVLNGLYDWADDERVLIA